MDHETAMKTEAIERYLLREMPDGERDAFEEHFFECSDCANELKAASAFLENLKTVVAEEPVVIRKPEQRDWFAWLRWNLAQPALTMALLAIVGYETLYLVPQLRQAAEPHMVTSAVLRSETRGEAALIRQSKEEGLLLSFDLPPGIREQKYTIELASADGRKIREIPAAAPPEGDPFQLTIPERLEAGVYTVRVLGGSRELARYQFKLEHR